MKTAATLGSPRMARICLGTLVGGMALAGIAAPAASAAPDCSKGNIDSTVATAQGQIQSYLSTHPDGQRTLMTAAMQPRPQAAATLQAYATANPQEYAEFTHIISPLGTLQKQCGVQVIPPQYQWAFDQFVG